MGVDSPRLLSYCQGHNPCVQTKPWHPSIETNCGQSHLDQVRPGWGQAQRGSPDTKDPNTLRTPQNTGSTKHVLRPLCHPPVERSSWRNHPSHDPPVLQILCWGLAAGQPISLNPKIITFLNYLWFWFLFLHPAPPSPIKPPNPNSFPWAQSQIMWLWECWTVPLPGRKTKLGLGSR